MRGRRGIGLNEIMIVNPSPNGRNGMLNRTNGHYGQPEDEDMGWNGMAGGIGQDEYMDGSYGALYQDELGAIPMDELGAGVMGEEYGSIPMDELGALAAEELAAGHCSDCGGEQLGYYTDDEDRELVGRYCPSCSGVGMGDDSLAGLVGGYGSVLADDELTGLLGEEGGEDALYGALLADDENYYGPADDGVDGPLCGYLAQDEYGQPEEIEDMGAMGYYGPHRDEAMGGPLGRYVREQQPAAFNPHGDFGTQLAGYQRERTVNASAELRSTVPVSPLHRVPQIFKPHF